MERGQTHETRLEAGARVLTEYFRLLDTIPDDMSIEDGEVRAAEYLHANMLTGQFTTDEIVLAHHAVAREEWGETGYERRIKQHEALIIEDPR